MNDYSNFQDTLIIIDSILQKLNSNPELLSSVDKVFKFFILIIILYIAFGIINKLIKFLTRKFNMEVKRAILRIDLELKNMKDLYQTLSNSVKSIDSSFHKINSALDLLIRFKK